MADRIQSSARVLCKGGLNTSENFLLLSDQAPGSATALINYETSLTGGYRRINGFSYYDSVAPLVTSVADPATGPVLGVWGYKDAVTGVFTVIAARKLSASGNYKIYRNTGGAWSAYVTGTTQSATGVKRVRAEIFTISGTTWIVFVDGVNKALVFNGTTWYQLNSANAGGAGSPGGNQTLNAPAVVTFFKGTVFFSGDSTTPGIVAYSAPNDPLTWTAAAGGGQLLPGFGVQQIKGFRNECYIFGQNAIKKAVPDTAVGFPLQDVTSNIGTIARDSVIEIGGDLLFLSPDGIRPVSGTTRIGDVELATISQSIQNTINDVITTYDLTELNAVVIRSKAQFRYFHSSSLIATSDSYGLIGCQRIYPDGVAWEFSQLNGIASNSAWSGYNASGLELVLHGDYSGNVFVQESGITFNGSAITSVCTFPYLDMGDTEIRKLFRNFDLFVRAEGDCHLSLQVAYDWDRTIVQNPSNYSFSQTGGIVYFDDGHLFDDGSVFAGSAQPVFNTDIQGSGYSIQFSLVNNSLTDSCFTLQGFVLEFSPKGRE
jgi:hypothetical protein